MVVYLTLTALVLIFSAFIQNESNADGQMSGKLFLPFDRQAAVNHVAAFGCYALMAAVSACRIAVGNDYWGYRENFKRIFVGRDVASEPGFNFIVYWMQKIFGYDNYLPIFGLFSLITVAFFVKALKDQASWFWGSMFLLLTSGYYFSSLNSVRYYLVIAIVMYAQKYVTRGEYLKFICWILFAALFHKSVLIVIPAYLIIKWISGLKLKAWMGIPAAVLLASLVFCRDLYRKVIFLFYPDYEASVFDNNSISIVNVGMGVCCVILCALCYEVWKEGHKEIRFYAWLNLAGLVLNVFGSFIPEVTRIGNYFKISQVFLIPALLYFLPKGKKKYLLTAGTVLAFTVYFAYFLKTAYDTNIRILPYLNWIFN